MADGLILESRERIFAAILLTSLSYLLFTLHDAVIKLLVVTFAVWQIMFFRSATILAGMVLMGGTPLLRESARSPIVKPMFLRSFVILAAWTCYYTAARDLQLAELTTIYFAAPIIVTVLSIPLLGERVPLIRWLAVLTGFAGVFIASNPSGLGPSAPVMLVLAAAFLWGLSLVLLRKIALSERTPVQLVLNNGFFLVTAGAALPFVWRIPDWGEFLMLLGAGVIAGFAQFTLFEGMKRAPISVIAPFEYTSLVWAFVLGFVIWGDIPRDEVSAGAALIFGAGLMIMLGEQFRRHPARMG